MISRGRVAVVLGRSGFSAILLAVASLVFYTVFLAVLATEPSAQTDGDDTGGNTNGVEGCENPEVVETFTESNSQITPPFEITGNTFRLSLEADLVQEGEFGFISIDSVDEEGLVVPFGGIFVNPVEGTTDESVNVLKGPGTFTLRTESENVQCEVTVEDCVGTNQDNGN
jgi:hypothetical protein